MVEKKNSKLRVQRDYKALLHSLWQVWAIERVHDEPIWQSGSALELGLNPQLIRIVVWNICKGVGGDHFAHDYRQLAYFSDLMLIQEALLSQRSLTTFCQGGFEVLHGASYRRRDRLRDGVLTAARAGSLTERQRIICKYPEPVFKTPKTALLSFYPLMGESHPLMVINIHATLVRGVRRAMEEIEHVMERLPKHHGPVLFAGDFNTFAPTYLRNLIHTLARHGLKPAPIINDPREPFGVLDLVFVRDLKVHRVEVATHVRSSDHFPLICHVGV